MGRLTLAHGRQVLGGRLVVQSLGWCHYAIEYGLAPRTLMGFRLLGTVAHLDEAVNGNGEELEKLPTMSFPLHLHVHHGALELLGAGFNARTGAHRIRSRTETLGR